MNLAPSSPRWLREIGRLLPTKSQIYLYGNIRDTFLYPLADEQWQMGSLREALFSLLSDMGYPLIGAYDVIDGMAFADMQVEGGMAKLYDEVVNTARKEQPKNPSVAPQGVKPDDPLSLALQQIRQCLANRQQACAFIIDYASQLVGSPASLGPEERLAFMRLLKAAPESRRITPAGKTQPLQNLLFVICDRLTDMPAWLYLGNPYTAGVEIELPRTQDRERFITLYFGVKPELGQEDLIDLTEGMTYRELVGLRSLANQPGSPQGAKKLIDYFRFGVIESQWDALKVNQLSHAEETLSARVLGQEPAVTAVCDVLRRARLHLSGAQHSSRTKPRGVLFFAGPTGVGKTELAKATANLIFGSDDACLRFDMSEYGQAHSDQKLLGAPPGYIGYEEGGQLTNRVRANPFSVLLFDEIEKAHPSILDKFLQILEDGRMTDGRGETVHFGESLIVFTSNVGIYQLDPHTGRPAIDPATGTPILNVDPASGDDYMTVRDKVTRGVHSYFKHFLGRPELLNRIGQNIVVFDFVRPDCMRLILERKVLPGIRSQICERWKLDVSFSDEVVEQLLAAASGDIASGGRGIGNLAEAAILNPLSRTVFDFVVEGESLRGKRLHVKRVIAPREAVGHRYELEWEMHGDS